MERIALAFACVVAGALENPWKGFMAGGALYLTMTYLEMRSRYKAYKAYYVPKDEDRGPAGFIGRKRE